MLDSVEKTRAVESLPCSLHGSAHTLYSNEQNLHEMLPRVDLLVGAVLVPGAKAPRLIKREYLEIMKPGAMRAVPELKTGVNTYGRNVTHEAVAVAHGIDYSVYTP